LKRRDYLAVIDYGMGNLHSVVKGLEKAGVKAVLTSRAAQIKESKGIIIPGVGAFRDAVRELKKRRLFSLIKKEVYSGKPVLGICLGMQLLFSESSEFGNTKGFGFIKGRVKRFKKGVKVPHMGWNRIEIKQKNNPLLAGIKNRQYFYFVHSYYAVPSFQKAVLTKTGYGNTIFTSGVCSGNVSGFQFHPEKSGESALKIYKNFYRMCKKADKTAAA